MDKGRRGELVSHPDAEANAALSFSIDWKNVKRVLVVRLRSIGDTVLATPTLIALKRFLPEAQIDILLEDWVAPLLEGFDALDNVISIPESSTSRAKVAWRLRQNKYDVAINLHGGTTATFLTFASGAPHRVGYSHYQYRFLHTHLFSSAADFWQLETTHSAEQQLALAGFAGVPVNDRPRSRLDVTTLATESLDEKFHAKTKRTQSEFGDFALFHPAAAFATKTWAVENFARMAEFLSKKGIRTVAVAARDETAILERLVAESKVPVTTFHDLTLPEITALASKARLFVGNDSGIAHIAAAVNTPIVVIFGSSNRDHWRPWTDAPSEIVYEAFPCQPCPGYECKEFGEPRCILSVRTESVVAAIEKLLNG